MDADLLSFITTVKFFGYWYLSGLVFTTILGIMAVVDGKTEEIRISDLEEFFGWALLGPLLGLLVLGIVVMKSTSGIREAYYGLRHKVLWRSKTSRSKAVLFGDKDSDDD
jgi:hypothetical protein